MKILLDLQGAQTESRMRGIGRQAKALAKAMIAQGGHDFHILLNRRLDEGMREVMAEFTDLISPSNIHVFEVPGATAERDRANLWRTFAAEHVREAAIARIAPDVVHVASLFEGFVDDAVTSIGRFDAPYLTAVTLHDLIPLADPARYLADSRVRAHWLRRAQFLKRADLLLAVSDFSAREVDSLLHIPPSRVAVISGGVDKVFTPAEAESGIDADALRRFELNAPYLLHVGAVDPRKNVELIMAAFGRLPEQLRSTHLIAFVGRLFDDEIGRLTIAATREGIPASRLRFCQHVSEADLVAIYRGAASVIFPSMHEGFGLPAVEGMACGAPTLVADATALREIITEPNYRFDPVDPADLAGRLLMILTDEGARSALREWGLRRARDYRWNDVSKRAVTAMTGAVAKRSQSARTTVSFRRKPLLAFFSPLPDTPSGVADYSAQLLRELARFYEIECIVGNGQGQSDAWISANFVLRDVDFFRRNAAAYSRILYSMGNSEYHKEIFDLIAEYPGHVILHDFFLSDLIDWMSNTGHAPYEFMFRELYRSHGLTALAHERREGRLSAVSAYPCNATIFENATGVIVHSEYARAAALALYGESILDRTVVVPHLRGIAVPGDRKAARERLGIGRDDFVVASFGVITERKCSADLVEAWLSSALAAHKDARLVFIGEVAGGEFGKRFKAMVADRSAITVTGYASREQYVDYLTAADVAVQLRRESRGETSGTILDCLAAGLPLIVNDHGPTGELPDGVVVKLPDCFTVADLAVALEADVACPALMTVRAQAGIEHLRQAHHPSAVGDAFYDVIESFSTAEPLVRARTLSRTLGDMVAPVYPDRDDIRRLSRAVGGLAPRIGLRQILYDVTVLAESDAKTGIQRVVRSILLQLILNPPAGFRIEPVRMQDHELRYARAWTAEALDLPSWVFPDDPVDDDAGDIYLSIDWVPDRLPLLEDWLLDFRRAGGRVVIGVHDLLPFDLPQYFPNYMPDVCLKWFKTCLRTADQFLCVSQAVADTVVRFGNALADCHPSRRIDVDFFHNAADLAGSLPTTGRPDYADTLLAELEARPTFLMVGTIEPRKGHKQVLEGFEALWRAGEHVNLAIVGKVGWMMDEFVARASAHPRHGESLFLIHDASDEFLDEIYAASTALIAASYGEGFGLPLIEAARHGTPVIARDIPVFREVAADAAFYFNGMEGAAVADAIREWRALQAHGKAPSGAMAFQTWDQSTQQVLRRIFATEHYGVISGHDHQGKVLS